MENLIINNWVFENQSLYNINIEDDLISSLKKVENAKLFGEETNGYYYLKNGFRFGFSENKIDEIGIDFSQTKSSILLVDQKDSLNLSTSKIHEVLNYLNDKFIIWKPIENNDSNYLVIKLEKTGIHFIFDIYTGNLDKIGKTNIDNLASS